MLSGKLVLHDIDDVEAYCITILERRGQGILPRDYEDALAFLVETAWELSLRYEQQRFRCFSAWASYQLGQRLYDWQRRQYGRTKWGAPRHIERPLPRLLSLEHRPDDADHAVLDHLDAGGLADLLGLQRARGSTPTGPALQRDHSQAQSAA